MQMTTFNILVKKLLSAVICLILCCLYVIFDLKYDRI